MIDESYENVVKKRCYVETSVQISKFHLFRCICCIECCMQLVAKYFIKLTRCVLLKHGLRPRVTHSEPNKVLWTRLHNYYAHDDFDISIVNSYFILFQVQIKGIYTALAAQMWEKFRYPQCNRKNPLKVKVEDR